LREKSEVLKMAIREIILIGHPVLRAKAKKIRTVDDEVRELASDMVETMRAAHGIGLAAPQVNVSKQLIVVELPKEYKDVEPLSGKPLVFVNPEIIKSSKEEVAGDEGCLSIPGYVGEVWRSKWIVVRAQDLKGKQFRLKARDLLARVIQHEIDHLHGVLFIDRVESPDKLWKVEDGGKTEREEVLESIVSA
jgi:peptide deformylase